MLEDYRQDYQEFYTIINNAIKEDKISHAYMFEIDENIDVEKFIKDMCKALIIRDKDKDSNISNLIEHDNYPNIKRIKSDGIWIKKEQILDVQSDFKKESLDDNLKIYIIEDATKLNKHSANTLLKFLEEPERNIVALLLTKNKYAVINTIVSRCMNISLKKKNYAQIDPEDLSYKIVEMIEKYKERSLPYLYQLILSSNCDKRDLEEIFANLQKIYNDFLHMNSDIDYKYNYYEPELLKNIDFQKDNAMIIKKIDAISKNANYLKVNVNIKTILDKIIIEVYGGD